MSALRPSVFHVGQLVQVRPEHRAWIKARGPLTVTRTAHQWIVTSGTPGWELAESFFEPYCALKPRPNPISQPERGGSTMEELHTHERPCASPPWVSYRCRGMWGWIMIGAKDDDDARREALRSSPNAKLETLQIWYGGAYIPVSSIHRSPKSA